MNRKGIAVYVRVSTKRQDTKNQEPDLRAWLKANRKGRPVSWFRDEFTGAVLKRPGMQKLDAAIRDGDVGTVVVWRLDRLGRTAHELLGWLNQLEVTGVEFISIRDAIDTTTPAGKLLRTMLAGFAEYEREVLSERIKAGISKAKAAGKHWGGRTAGHRTRLTPERLRSIGALLAAGKQKAQIARELGISERSVYRGIELVHDHPDSR